MVKKQGTLQKLVNIMAFGAPKPRLQMHYGKAAPSAYQIFLNGKINEMQRKIKSAGDLNLFQTPRMPFSAMIPIVENDNDILDSFGFLNDASVGQGYTLTAENQGIVDHIIENFLEPINADEITLLQGFENLCYGNSIWLHNPASDEFLTWYKLGAVSSLKLNSRTFQPEYYQTSAYSKLSPDELFHLTWRRSNASHFGLGLGYSLLSEVDYKTYNASGNLEILTRPAVTDMKNQVIHDALVRHHKTIGRTIISAPMVEDNTKLQPFADALNSDNPSVDHVVNFDAKLIESNASRRVMEADVKQMLDEEYIKASGNPETKLITAQGYTEASALAAIKAASIRLASFERYMSKFWQNNIIRVWYEANPWSDANGVPVPWKMAKAKMGWGKEDHGVMDAPSFVQLISNIGVLQSAGIKILSTKEIRANLRRFELELDADETLLDESLINTAAPLSDKELEQTAQQVSNIALKVDKLQMTLKNRKRYI